MRISYLAATTLVLGATALNSTATAACGGLSCTPHSSASTGYSHTSTGQNFGHTSYAHAGTSYGSTAHSSSAANCPTGTRPSSDGSCLISDSGSGYFGSTSSYSGQNHATSHARSHTGSHGTAHSTSRATSRATSQATSRGSSYGGSYTGALRSYRSTTGSAIAPLGSYAGQTRHTTGHMSGAEATHRYGSGSVSRSYTDGNTRIVPFSTNSTNISRHRIAGMGANEVLTPTQCPVSVYNPNGGKVMGCYSVGKIAPRTTVTRTVVRRRIVPHTVRVVRPIIYVRYPVPIAVPFPVYQPRPHMGYGYNTQYTGGCNAGYTTRYGQQWPGRPCGY